MWHVLHIQHPDIVGHFVANSLSCLVVVIRIID
jgi:hypothetical protein